MKKIFFFAAAAIGMMASCQKPDINVENPVDDSSLVAVQFNVDAPSLTLTKGMGPVDEWDGTKQTLYILGYERTTTDFSLDAETTLIPNVEAKAPGTGGKLELVRGRTAFIAAEAGDKYAKLVIDSFIDSLAVAVENVINLFQPDVVSIGGGMSREGEAILAPLRERVLHKTFGIDGMRTKIVAAEFKNDAGIIGAALLGLQYE